MSDERVADLQECLFHEIEAIQGIINRLARASFMVKGWCVSLVIASLLLRIETKQIVIPFIPLIVFWLLDAYYLRQERLFRELHSWVAKNRLSSSNYLFDFRTARFEGRVSSHFRIIFSITLALFYGGTTVLVVAYFLLTSATILGFGF